MSTTDLTAAMGASLTQIPISEAPNAHIVHFYDEDANFLDPLSRSLGATLGSGGVVVVIATPQHRAELSRRLVLLGVNHQRAVKQARYLALDAAETLGRFMREGWPDEGLFGEVIGKVLESAVVALPDGDRRVVAFGEMVAVLSRQGRTDAAVRLEQLWNGLRRRYAFSLQCAYPITNFQRPGDQDWFLKVCAEHSGVIPSESYTGLASEDERLRKIAYLQQQALMLDELSKTYEELRESEERYRLLVECVKDYAIFMLSPGGQVMSWNQGAQKIKGYSRQEILSRHFSAFYPPEDVLAGKPNRELEIALREGRFEDEGWRVRKDGSRFWANVVITPQRDAKGDLKGFTKVTRDITERKKAEEAIRDLSGRLLHAQDEVRRRMARELHDSAAQTLSALSLNLALLKTSPEVADHPKAGKTLDESISLVEEATREIRTFSFLLHPPALDGACLGSALRWYADGFAQRTKIRVDCEVSPGLERLPEEVEAALFRVAQEALTNVYRHSGSQTARVRLAFDNDEITLEIRDRGKGLPPGILEDDNSGPARLGVGIRGMRERLEQLGGRLQIESGSGGTRVIAILPVRTQVSTTA
ncbi:MAG TPA: PAS domain S-box protein [Terriglobia bacterium]|nr:PAS domain S-box protein [Terriglobia bacterium]